MRKETIDNLEKLGACFEAVAWTKKQKTVAQAWGDCERGDWMLWLIGKRCRTTAQRKKLVLAACKCARLSLKYVPEGEDRPLKAIRTAESWALGINDITPDDVQNATAGAAADAAAYAAADAAGAAAAADAAAYAAADAAGTAATADAAAYAAYAAADAVDAAYAADAAAYAAAYAARKETLKQCADIVREFYPNPPKI